MDRKTLQERLKAIQTENDEIISSMKMEDGVLVLDEARKSAFEKNLAEGEEIKAALELLNRKEGLDTFASAPAGTSVTVEDAARAAKSGLTVPVARKSAGELFIESDEFKALGGGSRGYTMATPFELKGDLVDLTRKDVYTDSPSDDARFGTTVREPWLPRVHRTGRVRDLFPVQPTTATNFEYFRVTGFTNNASVVPEREDDKFGLKPQSGLSFDKVSTGISTIAHYELAHRSVLADEPQLRDIIDTELLHGLALHEDYQILYGTGTGEDLLGFFNTPGIQQYAWSSGTASATGNPVADNKADAIRRAATKTYLAQFPATGVVVHPNDWEDMELTKDANGQYLLAVAIAVGGVKRVWQLPVVDTPAINEGQALVGAFGTSAKLYSREESSIRVSESHADLFVRNAIAILAEERIGFIVKRPESFCEVDLETPPSSEDSGD